MKIMSMRPCLVVSTPSTGVLNVCKVKNVPFKIKNVRETRSFDQGPLPPPLSTRYTLTSFM